jgi:hypothetical protein
MTTYIQNYGVTKSYIKQNNKKTINEIKWKGNYDGENANIELLFNDNGNKEHMKMKLDNDDLMELLNIQPIEQSLEQRLLTDFVPIDELYLYNDLHNIPKVTRKRKRKTKRKYNKAKAKTNKSKTNKSK